MIHFKNLFVKDKQYERIYKILFRYKSWIKLSIFLTIVDTLIQIPFPIITKIIIDEVLLKKRVELIFPLVMIVMATIPFMILIPWLKKYFLFKLTHKTGIMMRKALCEHFLQLDLSFFQRSGPGYFSARLFEDVDTLIRSIYQVLFPILNHIFLFLVGLLLIFYLNWTLAVIPCLFFPVYGFLNYRWGLKLRKSNAILAEKKAKNFEFFADMFQTIENIRYHVLERSHLRSFFRRESDIVRGDFKVFVYRVNLEALNNLMMILTPALVLIAGIFMIINNTMTLGEYVAFTTFMTYTLGPVKFFFSSNITFQDFRVALQRVREAFEWPKSHEYLMMPGNALPLDLKSGDIELESVFFSYPDRTGNHAREDTPPILKNIDLSIKEGERVVLMGKSGSGKTTLLKLIMGLYLPDKGTISIGGKIYNEIDVLRLRRQIAFVEQEPILFKGSIKDNIMLNNALNPNGRGKVEDAARSASAHDFIAAMKEGYETDITRLGGNLSVGQKQRIALSRFFYKGANLLILDEPTSAVDHPSAISIREALKNVSPGKTVIVVTHNPVIAEFADRIIVIDNGEIIKDGNFTTIFKNLDLNHLYQQQEIY